MIFVIILTSIIIYIVKNRYTCFGEIVATDYNIRRVYNIRCRLLNYNVQYSKRCKKNCTLDLF